MGLVVETSPRILRKIPSSRRSAFISRAWQVLVRLTLLLPNLATAQDFVYGRPEDLKGTLWVFVYTGSQMTQRNEIVDKLQKQLPNLRFAEDPRQADVVIIYASAQSDVFAGNWSQAVGGGTTTCTALGNTANCYSSGGASGYSAPMYLPVRSGQGYVLVRGEDGQLRLVLEHADQSRVLEKSPHSKFTSRFVKEYKKQNPELPADRPPRALPTVVPADPGQTLATPGGPGAASSVPTEIYAGDYTASISPDAGFQGRITLRFYGEAVAGTLSTSTDRHATIAGVRNGSNLSLTMQFSDKCPGAAKATAALDGDALVGKYAASDCLGEYNGSFALLRVQH